jgi:glycosyltransferase involved in cell wall biosynthesis
MTLLSILMPVYNEQSTVERAIREAAGVELSVPHEVVVIDDGSTDGTRRILDETAWPEGVTIHRHASNLGKGAAVLTALGHARGDLAAVLDADLEYRPADIDQLLPPLLDGRAGAVFGVRAFEGHTSHSYLYVLGNRGVTLVANVLFNVYLRDIMTCHKVMQTDLFRSLDLKSRGFDIEPEITARLLRRGERIYEIPVSYSARRTEDGKKLTALDGIRCVRTLIRCRLTP